MMLGESAFRPYYKPSVAHTAAGYEPSQTSASSQPYSSPEPVVSSSPGKERTRRRRTTFSPEQTAALEREYMTDRYMDSAKRANLAESLQLNEIQVKTWFQNRRAKDKKEGRREEKQSSPASTKADSASSASPPPKQDSMVPIQENLAASPVDLQALQTPVQTYSPALKAALESPLALFHQESTSPAEKVLVMPPCRLSSETTVANCNLATPAITTGPVPTSYADYLSLGLNPAISIPAVAYGSVYDVYGNYHQDYSGLIQQNTNPFFSTISSVDPQTLTQQPLANL